ncbi:Pentatricopeptide repeat-containing protein At1g31790 [Linum grandiflorum]
MAVVVLQWPLPPPMAVVISAAKTNSFSSSSSCRCQPNNQKPSSTSRLHLQLPPPRTPSTPLQQHQQQHTPPYSESALPASPPHRPGTRKPAASTSTSDILRLFHTLDLPLQPDLYVSLVKECTIQRNSASALRLHDALKQPSPLLVLLLNRLLLMHVSCGHFQIARQLFDEMPPDDDNHHHQLLQFPRVAMVYVLKACMYTENKG